MKHFDHIVSALVLSGAASFAAMGCAAPSDDGRTGEQSANLTGQALPEAASGGVQEAAPANPGQPGENPKLGQGGAIPEAAPATVAQPGENPKLGQSANPRIPEAAPANVGQPGQEVAPVKGEFGGKKSPKTGQAGNY